MSLFDIVSSYAPPASQQTFHSFREECLSASGEDRAVRATVCDRLAVRFAGSDPELSVALKELARKLRGQESFWEWESYAVGDPIGQRVLPGGGVSRSVPALADAIGRVLPTVLPVIREQVAVAQRVQEMDMLSKGTRVFRDLKALSPAFSLTDDEVTSIANATKSRLPTK